MKDWYSGWKTEAQCDECGQAMSIDYALLHDCCPRCGANDGICVPHHTVAFRYLYTGSFWSRKVSKVYRGES